MHPVTEWSLYSTKSSSADKETDLNQSCSICFSVIRGLEDDVSNVSHQLSELQSFNQDLSESKVRLELRAVDLEEQRDRTIEEAKELEVTIKNLKTDLQVRYQKWLLASAAAKSSTLNIWIQWGFKK